MNLVNKDLVDLVHNVVGFLRAECFTETYKPLHIAEHDCDLLALTLDPILLGQDLLSEALGEITLNLV